MITAAFLIWSQDFGPVFYTQVRTGLGGETFLVWKLRTMRVDSEKDGAQWAVRDDSRITRLGYWLRKTRIDELPQLLSVHLFKMQRIN